MAKTLFLILALSVYTAKCAVTQTKDAIHKRVERSPCYTCGDHGPPPQFGPPPGYFRAHQWSGLARSGDQHGVFSGASAAIGGQPQAGGEAISLAATGDTGINDGIGGQSAGYGGWGVLNAGSSAQSSSSSQSSSSTGPASSSAGSSAKSGGLGGQYGAGSQLQPSSGLGGKSIAGSESQTTNFDGLSTGSHGNSFGGGYGGRSSYSSGFKEWASEGSNGQSGNLGGHLLAGSNAQSSNAFDSHGGVQDSNFGGGHSGHHGHHHHGSSSFDQQSFGGSNGQSGDFGGQSAVGLNTQSSNAFDSRSSRGYGGGFGGGYNGGSSNNNHHKSSAGFIEQSAAGSNAQSSGFGGGPLSAGSELQSSNSDGYRGLSSSQSHSSHDGFNGQSSNGFGGSSSSHGGNFGGKSSGRNNYAYQEFQSSQNGKLDAIGHINSDSSSHGFTGSQELQSSGLGGSEHQAAGFGSSGGSTSGTKSAGGYDSNSNGYSYYKSQSALKGALNLASQGLDTAGQNAGCSTCGKGSYAFSNAKSDSGDAVAVSVTG